MSKPRVRVAAGDPSGASVRPVPGLPVPAPPEGKASAVGSLISAFQVNQPQYTPRNFAALADEGFAQNVINYFCIGLISDAFASMELSVFRGDNEVPDHPVAGLLAHPNPSQGGSRFRRSLMSYYLLAGTAYVEAVPPGSGQLLPRNPRPPNELWTHRPDRITVIPGDLGLPRGYRYRTAGGSRDWAVDQITGRGYLLQLKEFHPLNDWYGLGGVEAAARWIDLDNAGASANAALLMNGGNPSSLFSSKSQLTPEQVEAVRARLHSIYSGTANWGEPLILGGDWDVKRISATLADMQWTQGMHEAARRMCLAWRVPHIIVVPGESTYANREAADLELYDHAVLPRARIILEDLNGWLRWLYQDDLIELRVDVDKIAALETRRETKRKSVRDDYALGLISLEEARDEIGYGDPDATQHFSVGPLAAPRPVPPAFAGPQPTGLQPEQPAQPEQPLGPAGPGASPGQPPPAPGARPRLVALPGGAPAKAAPDQPRHPAGVAEGGRWRPAGPDDPVTPAEADEGVALAAELVDDALMTAELAPVLRDAVRHFARRALDAGLPAAKGGDPESETVSDLDRPGAVIDTKALFDPLAQQVAEFVADVANRALLLGATTRQRLGEAFARARRAGSSLVGALRQTFEGFSDRTPAIARTEATRAAGYGSQLGMQAAGVMLKSWASVHDERVRDAHRELDGQVVPLDQPFRYRGHQTMFPGGFGIAELDVGCRCLAVPFRSDVKAADAKAERAALVAELDAELREFEARVAEAVRQALAAQERRAMVRLHERERGAA